MITPELIKEAALLRNQCNKGTVVVPAIVSFLSKIEGFATVKTRQSKVEKLAEHMEMFDRKPRKARI